MDIEQKLDLIARLIEEFGDTQEIVEFLTGIADRLKKSRGRTVCKETLDFLRGQIDWNKEDQGGRGEYIKTEYVYNLIDDLEKALISNRVRMNWPFLEERTQDGANREMDEEDSNPGGDTTKEPNLEAGLHNNRWYVYDRNQCVGLGKYKCTVVIDREVPEGKRESYARKFAAAFEMLEVLEMVRELPFYGASQSVTITSEQRCAIISAINKARGE